MPPKTKGKPIVRNIIENRDNYRRWPWTSFLVLGISTGSIFFTAGSLNQIADASGVSFILKLVFLVLGSIFLLPSVVVVLILFWYCFLNAIGTKVPEKCQCLYWFAIRNKTLSQSVNFYNHKPRKLSVWTVEGQLQRMKRNESIMYEVPTPSYHMANECNNNHQAAIVHQPTATGPKIPPNGEGSTPSNTPTPNSPTPYGPRRPRGRSRDPDGLRNGGTVNRAFQSDEDHGRPIVHDERSRQAAAGKPKVRSLPRTRRQWFPDNNLTDTDTEQLIDSPPVSIDRSARGSNKPSTSDSISDRNSVLTGTSEPPPIKLHTKGLHTRPVITRQPSRGAFSGNNSNGYPVVRNHVKAPPHRDWPIELRPYQPKKQVLLPHNKSPRPDKYSYKRPRSNNRRRRPRAHYSTSLAPPGTTADSAVFPEKISLKVRDLYPVSERSRRRLHDDAETSFMKDWNKRQTSLEDNSEDEDSYSTTSSWIAIPWSTYKLPEGFEDPNELSV